MSLVKPKNLKAPSLNEMRLGVLLKWDIMFKVFIFADLDLYINNLTDVNKR